MVKIINSMDRSNIVAFSIEHSVHAGVFQVTLACWTGGEIPEGNTGEERKLGINQFHC